MKDLYVLVYDGEIIYASEDGNLLREIVCDMFFEDAMMHFDRHIVNTNDFNKLAKASWDKMIEWYYDYVYITKISKDMII